MPHRWVDPLLATCTFELDAVVFAGLDESVMNETMDVVAASRSVVARPSGVICKPFPFLFPLSVFAKLLDGMVFEAVFPKFPHVSLQLSQLYVDTSICSSESLQEIWKLWKHLAIIPLPKTCER